MLRRTRLLIALFLLTCLVPAASSAGPMVGAPSDTALSLDMVGFIRIYGRIVDAATGQPPAGAKVRVYRRDPATGQFWGIDGPQGAFIYPGADGRWSVTYRPLIQAGPQLRDILPWLVVTLIYEPGWSALQVQAPPQAIVNGARLDWIRPPWTDLGSFDFRLTLATPTPTLTPGVTVVPPTSMPTVLPPTATSTPTQVPTVVAPTRVASTLRFLPMPASVAVGELVTVEVWLENVTNLYGLGFDAVFSPTLGSVPVRQAVPFWEVLDPYSHWVITNTVDNDLGTLTYGAMNVNPATPFSGSGRVCAFSFEGLVPGITALHFATVQVASPDGLPIAVIPEDGVLQVTAPRQ